MTIPPIPDSELIVNPDGSIFHLKIRPEQLAHHVLLVGDPGRVNMVSSMFDSVQHKIQNREFVTHTGTYRAVPFTVLSTGIGTDNIDIVLNELDALVNIDLHSRTPNKLHVPLNLIRLGTSGALQEDIPVDHFVASEYGLGMDGLLHFYRHSFEEEAPLLQAFLDHVKWPEKLNMPYLVKGNEGLLSLLGQDVFKGITATASGFYGPQGRTLRISPSFPDLNERLTTFHAFGKRITNFEMETSALFGLGRLLGHRTATICAIIANRIRKEYSKDYKKPVEKMIGTVLDRLSQASNLATDG
jgi:uridine phosphorylase